MENKNNQRCIVKKILAALLVLTVIILSVSLFINTKPTKAAPSGSIEIKVNKVTTVSIYAFGDGVEFISSTGNYDTYYVEIGTTVRLQAVNETRIFTSWSITKTSNPDTAYTLTGVDLTKNIINIDITETTPDLTVTVNRRDALAEDYGKYMLDRFVIVDENDLIALQNILAGSNNDNDFALYYDNPSLYNTTYKKNTLRKNLQYGYFLIANNFTVFNESFTGIGTNDTPFQGIMCGLNGIVSKIFVTITVDEATSDAQYGLFKYLGNEAVIRNLKLSVSIGVTPKGGNANTTIYAGGLAAVMNKSTLIDVEVSASIGIESNLATKIYAGGIAGKMNTGTGIDSISDVVYEGTECKWSITSHKQNSEIHAGLIAGTATDTYIKEVDIIATNQSVDLKNSSVENSYTNSKLYLGNLFGSYIAEAHNEKIDDVMIMGNAGETLSAMTTNGDAMVGGLIGYVDASKTGTLNLGKIYFRVLGSSSEYNASTINPSSIGNVYAGGIFGYVNGNKAYALNEFKNRLETIVLEDKTTILDANYLFDGDYTISATQNGKSTATTNGKAIAGGIVGKGLFELNGSSTNQTTLALAAPNAKLTVEATQTKLTTTTGSINDKEHACAALIYGSVNDTKVSMNNISVYSNNTTVITTREIGSKALGDLHTGGFISFARNGSSFSNINMYLNDSSILSESLSYEAKNTSEDTNSAFCGGFAGELLENSSLTNFVFAGFDSAYNMVGTTSHLESIQNTIPGGGNYRGENYIGGVVGRIQYVALTNCKFIGSNTNKDYVRMSGHESPDSAFCGGIVGLIRTAKNDVPSSVKNCEVIDTEVIGNATCIIKYDNPDIYIGGIIGAAYIHDTNSASTVIVSNCRLTRSNVYALGNEIITSFAGGIIGGSTWQSSIAISDCYVTDSSISANVTTKLQNTNTLESTAGGIMGGMKGNPTNKNVNISNCVVIDTDVDAQVNSTYTNISAYSAGILGYMENATSSNIPKVTISNCYSNAYVTASHQSASGNHNVYGITFNGTISTTSKQVNTTVPKVTYNKFTYPLNAGNRQGYTFEVANQGSGTYKIKDNSKSGTNTYVLARGTSISYTRTNNATSFTYSNGYLVYNGNYISMSSSNAIGITTDISKAFNFGNVEGLNVVTTSLVQETTNVASGNSYYLNKNVKNASNTLGTAVGTGPFNIPNNETAYPYSAYNYLYGFDGFGQKFYIEIIDNSTDFTANNQTDKVASITSNTSSASTALAHVWINVNVNGNTSYVPTHEDKETAAQNGWFILDYVLLYSGGIENIESDISKLETSYTNGTQVYKYNEDGKYLENKNDSNDKIYNNYGQASYQKELNGLNYNIKEFTFKVYDDMLTFNANFELTHFGANYQLRYLDENGNIIDESDFTKLYGTMTLKLVEKHASMENGVYTDKYSLEYIPNEDLADDAVFYVRFVGGNNAVATKTFLLFNLIANKLQLVGVTYADYTPPLNYYDTTGTLGANDNPYQLHVSSITKFIPIFTKSNDIVPNTKYILEEYIEKCSYSINSSNFEVHSNGELITGSTTGQQAELIVQYKKTGESVTVYIKSANDISVSYSSVGAEVVGITHTSDSTDFYFEQLIRSNYSGVPDSFIITIGSTKYDLTNDPNKYTGIKIYHKDTNGEISTETITSFDADYHSYTVLVDKSLLKGSSSLSVAVEYPVVCIITFKLQCQEFNNLSEKESTKSFKIIGGTSFKDYFTSDVLDEIEAWCKSAEVFGFVFTGFYLVNDANTIHSYGISFADLVESEYKINSSNTFYGRWSYLIELIESPGTYIKTGFNSEFMQEYKEDDFTRSIQIPINNNQGYVFRVDKDTHYIGEVGTEAYVVHIVDGVKEMIPIPIENYQNNKNLYYVRPEYITGYLVIMTTVGNSEVIVGEHTTSITENITPEDGVITFKYVVNHYYDENGEKSYIFNLSNGLNYKTLYKEFVLDFYKQSTHEDLKLPDLTEIRLYYNCYVDGGLTSANTLVGTYITNNDDRVYITEFKQLDLETQAFGNTITFQEFIESKVKDKTKFTITEVFYFSIIPPNGYSEKVQNEMANYVVECGYCEGKVPKGEAIKYLEGVRTKLTLANPNDLDDVINENTSDSKINYVYETSKQEKIYHVIPTRVTEIVEEDENTFTFIDNNTYTVYDILLTNTQKLPDFNYISLYDNETQSILESSVMEFNIKELRLRLGYRLGNVKVYGMTKDGLWKEVATINVTSAVYEDYIIDFKSSDGSYPYYAYKIDNISTNEIRVSKIDVLSAVNNVLYEGSITNFVEKNISGNVSTYSLTNNIVGDSRHDGKLFMLAIQLVDKQSGKIVESIEGDVYINILDIGLGTNHYVYMNEYSGKNVAYINLTQLLKTLNVKQIKFDVTIPDKYEIYAIQILEVSNEYKPSQGDVRDQYINPKYK